MKGLKMEIETTSAMAEPKPSLWRSILCTVAAFAFIPMCFFGYMLHISMIGHLKSQVGTGTAVLGDMIPIVPDAIYWFKVITGDAGDAFDLVCAYGAVSCLAFMIVGFVAFLPELRKSA